MTEKRFINDIDIGQLIDTKGELSTIDYSDKVDFYELWEFLNKLNDENEQLNSRIRYLENKIQRERNATTKQHLRWSDEAETKIKELSKENEELREQVKCLLEDLQSTNQINKEIVDDVREELLKENEQLKRQNRQLSLIGEKQADFIRSKGFDIKELIDFARDGSND